MKRCTQFIVGGKLCLPECKPDIACMLRVTAKAQFGEVYTQSKKVHFNGCIALECEYVAAVPECSQPVHFVSFRLPFSGVIGEVKICDGMQAQLGAKVRRQEVALLSPRSLKSVILLRVGLLKVIKNSKLLCKHSCIPDLVICGDCCMPTTLVCGSDIEEADLGAYIEPFDSMHVQDYSEEGIHEGAYVST